MNILGAHLRNNVDVLSVTYLLLNYWEPQGDNQQKFKQLVLAPERVF
jgi:hypothetical protein